MREPSVRLLSDPADSPEHDAALRAVHDPAGGIIVAEVVPSERRGRMAVADALLRAMGKDLRASGSTRDAADRWDAAIAWMAGEQITDVVFLRAQLLDRRLWALLIGACAQTGARLWLSAPKDQLARGQRQALHDWPSAEQDSAALAARTEGRPANVETRADGEDFPVVCDDEFLTFLSTCRELLTPREFEQVRARMIDGYRMTRSWLRRSPRAGEDDIAGHLQAMLADTSSISSSEALTLLRGAQVACLHDRLLLLRVNVDRLLALSAQNTARRLTQPGAQRLRGYLSTRHAAAGALSAITGADVHALREMNVDDLAADGSAARAAGRTHPVPEFAQGIVRAHRTLRVAQGAQPADPLFTYAPGGGQHSNAAATKRASAHAVQMTLSRVKAETGLAISAQHTAAPDRAAGNWRRRHGISVRPLKGRRR